MSMVPGSVECRTCCLSYITLVNSLSSACVYVRRACCGLVVYCVQFVAVL